MQKPTHYLSYIAFAMCSISFLSSCGPDTEADIALYSQNDVNKESIQVVTTNFATGMNSVFSNSCTDSLSRAELAQTLTHGNFYLEDASAYLFIETESGYSISHPKNWALEGNSSINQTDAYGKEIIPSMIAISSHIGFGFLEYYYDNNGTVEEKLTFIKSIPVAGWYAGSGFYYGDEQPLISLDAKNEKIVEQAVKTMAIALANELASAYDADSLGGVAFMREFLQYIRFYDDQSGYFYVIDFSGYNVVQPPNPAIQGTYEWDIQDSRGNYLVRDLIQTAQTGGGYCEYYWENYQTGTEQLKKAYVRQIPGTDYLIGSGIYIQ